jgi:hypothetical protein
VYLNDDHDGTLTMSTSLAGSRYWWQYWKHLPQWWVQWSSDQCCSRWKLWWVFQWVFHKWTWFKHCVMWSLPPWHYWDSKEKSFLSCHLVQSLHHPTVSPIHLAPGRDAGLDMSTTSPTCYWLSWLLPMHFN